MSDFEPSLRDPRVPVHAEAGGNEARGELLPCFDCGQSDHGMHDPRCHVEQMRQGHRVEIQMLQRELQLLRERNAAVPPQHHHRYASGTTQITIHQYGGAPPLPATLFDRRSTPTDPVVPRAVSRALSRRSPSLPAPVAASPPGSWSRGSRRYPYSRGPAKNERSAENSPPRRESDEYSRRGPSSWTWVRGRNPAASGGSQVSSGSEVCLVTLPSCEVGPVVSGKAGLAKGRSPVIKVESLVQAEDGE